MSERIGRYLLFDEFARGGMATVHLGRLDGPVGFRRIVAIKRLNKEAAEGPETRLSLQDEALISSRIIHRNVVQVFDVVESAGNLLLVMEYVHGLSLSALLKEARARREPPLPAVACAIIADALEGLQAAHEATDAEGKPLEIVHRDMSPQNILVGADGVSRVLDFGIAKARVKMQHTSPGLLKGKILYMAPEQIHGKASRASDIYSTGLVLYEALIGKRAFEDQPSEGEAMAAIMLGKIQPLRELRPDLPVPLVQIVDRALSREPAQRFASAREMAVALRACGCAPPEAVARWVAGLAGSTLEARQQVVRRVESSKDVEPEAAALVPARPAGRPLRTTLGAGAALFALAGLAAAGVLWRRATPPAHVAAPAAAPAPSTAAPPAAPEPPAPAAAVPRVTVPPVDVVPAAAPGHRAVSKSHRRDRRSSARPDCDPPYRIDQNGHKQFKAECF
ncbi:MAG TPA: serine/threonine-protein kinase [Myxococcales bacterium]|nr:serine/threonine-protein kinase [Myxococcales bacterium]